MRIAGLFLYGLAAALVFAAAGCSSSGSSDIRVMTFNIRLSPEEGFDGENCWNNRREAVVRMITECAPDIFGIQEGIIHQVDYMAENLPGYSRYGVCRDDGLDRGEANAVFWRNDRFALLQCDTYWLSETPDTVSLGWDGACRRIVTWAQLRDKATGRDLWFFNTHFDHVGRVAREQSGKLVVSRMESLVPEADIVFLTGDFNANWDNDILEPVRSLLMNCRETAPVTDDRNTFNDWGKRPVMDGKDIIDHIFYRGAKALKYEVISADYGAAFISDHWPVMGTFEIN